MTDFGLRKFLAYFFFMALIIGCGNDQIVKGKVAEQETDSDAVLRTLSLPERTIDSVLKPFLDEFRVVLGERGIKEKNKLVSLVLRDLPSGYAGYCVTKPIDQKDDRPAEGYVVIDSKLSDFQLRAVIWHELGHCLFNLKHSPDAGIMNEYIPSDAQLNQNWSRLQWDYLELLNSNLLPANEKNFTEADDHIGLNIKPGKFKIESVSVLAL